jgi:hypothetical protein
MHPLSASFMRKFVELSAKQAEITSILRTATYLREFEETHKVALNAAFKQIAAAAATGAVRMPLAKDDFLTRNEVMLYMGKRGFEYTTGHGGQQSIEWWAKRDEEDKRLE